MKSAFKFIPLLLIPLTIVACNKNSSSSSEKQEEKSLISLSHTSITLSEDKTFQLEANLDDSLKGKLLFWTMRDDDIASVENGLVKAIKEGNTICTVQCGQYSAKCAVNVTSFEPEDALHIHLSKSSFNLNVNDTFDLPISVSLGNEIITDYTLSGQSDDDNVAKIEEGAVKALSTGSTSIVLKVEYQTYVTQDVINVNVY